MISLIPFLYDIVAHILLFFFSLVLFIIEIMCISFSILHLVVGLYPYLCFSLRQVACMQTLLHIEYNSWVYAIQ
jgi:hypothetical protein